MAFITGQNFSLILDKRQPSSTALKFIDTGIYSPGIAVNFTGWYSVLQPDGVTAINGSFTSPSIFWNSGALTSPLSELRFNTANTFQSGNYTILYYLRCPGFDDTVLTKTFNFQYTAPIVVLTPNLDLFTPKLQVVDATNYAQTGMTLNPVPTRAWAALITSVLGTPQNISSAAVEFDMNYLGSYYDSRYDVTLTVNPLLVLEAPYDWVTLIDNLEQDATYYAQIPATIEDLDADMAALKNTMDANINNCNTYNTYQQRYVFATSLYSDFRRRGCDGLPNGLDVTLNQLLKLFNNNVNPTYVNTNTAIGAYDWMCGDFTTTVPWSAITGKPATADIEWTVGAVGFPGNGAISMTDARFANAATAQLVVFRNGQVQFSADQGDGDTFYTKASTASNTIGFSAALNTGEKILIKIIAL